MDESYTTSSHFVPDTSPPAAYFEGNYALPAFMTGGSTFAMGQMLERLDRGLREGGGLVTIDFDAEQRAWLVVLLSDPASTEPAPNYSAPDLHTALRHALEGAGW